MALFIARREIHQTFWISRTFALFSSPRFSIFLALSASHHLATLRLASLAAKNLESLPSLRANLPSSLERSVRRQFGALSLLKVESTVCFQRKRRRERAVTRERNVSFAAKNLESLPSLRSDLPFRLERSAWAAVLLLFTFSCFCFFFPAFVSQIDQKWNKRGQKETNTGAKIGLSGYKSKVI